MKSLLILLLLVPLASLAADDHGGKAAKNKVPEIGSGNQAAAATEQAGDELKTKIDEHGGEAVKSKAEETASEHGGQPLKKKVDEHAGKAVQ